MKKIKVVVKKKFTDRYTGIVHKPGNKLTVSEVRFREMMRSGDYVAKETAAPTPAKNEAPEKVTNETKK